MDPLKPFSSAIRSLWLQTTRTSESAVKQRGSTANANSSSRNSAPAEAVEPLRTRLRNRFVNSNVWDASAARTMFVESVVLDELGDQLAYDPAFSSVVNRVGEQLASDSQLSARLDELLRHIADNSTAPDKP